MPLCFKRTILSHIMWQSSQKAWMTQHIYEDWLVDFNRKMCLQNRKVFIFSDNASCHVKQKNRRNLFLERIITMMLKQLMMK